MRSWIDFWTMLGSSWSPCGVPFGLRDATMTSPRRSKTLSRRSQDAPKTLKDANEAPQEAPRGPNTPPSSILNDFSSNFQLFFIDFFIDSSWVFHWFFIDVLICWDYSGSILGVFWKYSGNILGLFWEYSGSITPLSSMAPAFNKEQTSIEIATVHIFTCNFPYIKPPGYILAIVSQSKSDLY